MDVMIRLRCSGVVSNVAEKKVQHSCWYSYFLLQVFLRYRLEDEVLDD